jgi:hypothetical protein
MSETNPEKESGRPALELAGAGPDTATEVSKSEHKMVFRGSPFARCGHITLEKDNLRISYDSLGINYTVFILEKDLRAFTGDRYAPPMPIHEIQQTPDGSGTIQKVGYAHRSLSGQALVIETTTSGGDLVIPWSKLQYVVNRKRKSAPISRIRDKAIIPPRPPAPTRDILNGLARGF